MKTHIITIFDKNYLGRALAFRASLTEHAPGQHLYMLCLDDACYETAKRLGIEDTTLMRAEDLRDPELMRSRDNRTLPEFASTCKPAFLLWMMKTGKVAKDDLLVFIDPDFVFYRSPEELWSKMYSSGSIIVTPHRFSKNVEQAEKMNGRYNAGICGFKNDGSALACLTEWRKQCIEWCYLRYENGKIGDQGYMTDWKSKYSGVYELMDPGVNVASWNIDDYRGESLICYHFHGTKFYESDGQIKIPPALNLHKKIYAKYEELLTEAYKKIRTAEPNWKLGIIPHPGFLRLLKQSIWKIFA
jgi:hypothetical protein